jgi:hypothetical protein
MPLDLPAAVFFAQKKLYTKVTLGGYYYVETEHVQVLPKIGTS